MQERRIDYLSYNFPKPNLLFGLVYRFSFIIYKLYRTAYHLNTNYTTVPNDNALD